MNACPINFIKVDETAVRVNSGLNLLLIAAYFYFGEIAFIVLLGVDYLLKQTCPKNSPFGLLAKRIVALFRLKPRNVDSASKRFASFLGFIMVLAALALFQADQRITAESVIGLFALCTFLEGATGFCVGCMLYRLLPARFKGIGR